MCNRFLSLKILVISCPQHVTSKYRESVGRERETIGISCFSPHESPGQETDLNLSESLCPVFKTLLKTHDVHQSAFCWYFIFFSIFSFVFNTLIITLLQFLGLWHSILCFCCGLLHSFGFQDVVYVVVLSFLYALFCFWVSLVPVLFSHSGVLHAWV